MGLKELFKKRNKGNNEYKDSRYIIESNSPIVEGAFTKEHLGLALYDDSLAPLIEIGTQVPVSKKYTFSTTEDGQDQIILTLCRGKELLVENSFPLGKFQIIGIPSLPAKEPLIEVTFSIDGSNINLTAKDSSNGNYLEIVRIFQN